MALALSAVLGAAAYGAYETSEAPRNQFWGTTLTGGPATVREVALTFDDGPNPPYTNRILDVLARDHAHATFFVVGRAAKEHPEVLRRIVREGHAIGNHTWDHAHLIAQSARQIRAELDRTDAAVFAATRTHTHLMRPPFGSRDFAVIAEARQAGYTVVMWSDPLSEDWKQPGVETIVARVVARAHDGSILVLHDGNRGEGCTPATPAPCDRSQEAAATHEIITALRARGFRFVTVPQLAAEPLGVTRSGVRRVR